MIYVTGDLHGHLDSWKLNSSNIQRYNLTSEDYLIICGDFGIPFLTRTFLESIHNTALYDAPLQLIKDLPCTVLWIDGNHENFDYWSEVPYESKWGGRVQHHPEAENCYHLCRGEFYEIDGLSLFTIGGAMSIDKAERKEGFSWWSQEVLSEAEEKYILNNMAEHNYTCDIILTHTLPLCCFDKAFKPMDMFLFAPKKQDPVSKFLDVIFEKMAFRSWYLGHFHVDLSFKADGRDFTILFDEIKPVN